MKTVLSLSIMLCIIFLCIPTSHAITDHVTEALIERAMVIAKVRVISFEESEHTGTAFYTLQVDNCVKGGLNTTNMLVRVPKSYRPSKMVGEVRELGIGQPATLYLEAGPQGIAMSSVVLALVPDTNRIN